jgi:MFS family permease
MFKRAWLASILTYIALLIQGVGVAWLMLEIADDDAMVAWVQSAIYLPLMLLSIPAGAIADVFNKKIVTLIGLIIAFLASLSLYLVTTFDLVTPTLLLSLCIMTGIGMALYDPAWQTAVPLIVPEEALPQAIALRSMSQNMARAIAPAIGGVIIALVGGTGTFLTSSLLFTPFLLVIAMWAYTPTPPRLPPERIDHAISTGLRYVANSPLSRTIILRGFLISALGIGILALMPLVTKQVIGGGSIEYGILLGAFGIGAVIAAKYLKRIRDRFDSETLVTMSTATLALGAFSQAIVSNIYVLSILLIISGMGWLTVYSTLNTRIQMLSPRWVMGRTFATYAAATTAGMVFGGLLWGQLLSISTLQVTLIVIGSGLALMLFADTFIAIPQADAPGQHSELDDSHINMDLAITHRSGPICMQKEYRVAPENARPFYRSMQKLERMRLRNGAYNWSLSRDITNQEIWIERYHMSTWLDYLRMRERHTERDTKTQNEVRSYLIEGSEIQSRYHLERPIGSVRWDENVIDNKITR